MDSNEKVNANENGYTTFVSSSDEKCDDIHASTITLKSQKNVDEVTKVDKVSDPILKPLQPSLFNTNQHPMYNGSSVPSLSKTVNIAPYNFNENSTLPKKSSENSTLYKNTMTASDQPKISEIRIGK